MLRVFRKRWIPHFLIFNHGPVFVTFLEQPFKQHAQNIGAVCLLADSGNAQSKKHANTSVWQVLALADATAQSTLTYGTGRYVNVPKRNSFTGIESNQAFCRPTEIGQIGARNHRRNHRRTPASLAGHVFSYLFWRCKTTPQSCALQPCLDIGIGPYVTLLHHMSH